MHALFPAILPGCPCCVPGLRLPCGGSCEDIEHWLDWRGIVIEPRRAFCRCRSCVGSIPLCNTIILQIRLFLAAFEQPWRLRINRGIASGAGRTSRPPSPIAVFVELLGKINMPPNHRAGGARLHAGMQTIKEIGKGKSMAHGQRQLPGERINRRAPKRPNPQLVNSPSPSAQAKRVLCLLPSLLGNQMCQYRQMRPLRLRPTHQQRLNSFENWCKF